MGSTGFSRQERNVAKKSEVSNGTRGTSLSFDWAGLPNPSCFQIKPQRRVFLITASPS